MSRDLAVNPAGVDLLDLLSALTLTLRTGERWHRSGAIAQQSGINLERALHPILFALDDANSIRVTDLAAMLGVSSPTASRHITTLVRRGLVNTVANHLDSRVTLVELTDQGREVLNEVRESWRQVLAEAIHGWSQHERTIFLRGFATFAESWSDLVDRELSGSRTIGTGNRGAGGIRR